MRRLVWYRGRWAAYERIGGRPRRTSLGTTARPVAERRLADLERLSRQNPTTISEMFDRYLEDRGPLIASQGTLRFAWARLLPVFGHLRPDQIDRARSRAYAAHRARHGVGQGTIRRELAVLRAIVRYNDRASPAIIEMPHAPPPRDIHLSREEYRALREAARSVPHLYVFVVLAYSTAGRASAILELTWNHVSFERKLIALGSGEARVKGRATVPMTENCHVTLEEARRASISEYVVEYAGRRVRSVKRAFKAALARAGIRTDVGPHILRHSAAVHMAEGRVSMEEIATFLGHTDTRITYRVYARFSPDYLRKAARALE